MTSTKGVATTAGTIMVIVIFLTFFGIYLYMVDNVVQSNVKLNLESLELLRLKSTFSLFNRSLGATWFVSTVQTIFATADESVGCGWDDGRMPRNYWYRGGTSSPRDFALDKDGKPKERIPETAKYNAFGMNPQICYPRDSHIIGYMKEKLVQGKYLDLKNPVSAAGVSIDREAPVYEIILNDKSINSLFTQRIVAKTTSGTTDAKTTNNNAVETSLKRMIESGRKAVENLLTVGDNFYSANDPRFNYQPADRGIDASINKYKEKISSVVKGAVSAANLPYQNDITAITDVKKIEVVASDISNIVPGVPWSAGLIVSYNATIRYIEKATSQEASQVEFLQWPGESRRVTSCYGYRQDPISDDVAKFHSGLDIGPAIVGVGEPVKAIADGTVTVMNNNCPFTCGDYGNYVSVYHESQKVYSFYAHLSSISVNVGDSVTAGTQLGIMGSTGRSTGVHLHLEIRRDGTTATRVDPCNYLACSESTGKICTAVPDSEKGIYYYYDESTNTFEKRPIILEIGAEDHLPALNCQNWAGFPEAPVFKFNLIKQSDIACCGGYIFACDVTEDDLPNLNPDQSLGLGEQTSDDIEVQGICNGRLQGGALSCTAEGFK